VAARGAPNMSDQDAALTIPANRDGEAALAGREAAVAGRQAAVAGREAALADREAAPAGPEAAPRDTAPAGPEADGRDAAPAGPGAVGREAADRGADASARDADPASIRAAPDTTTETVRDERKNRSVDLGRIAWLVTVLSCLLAVAILIPQGYYGYAGVTFAVALAAAINLT
jgi:hypothetical protein